MSGRRLLVLGPDAGWHADRLRCAASRQGHELSFAPYESLAAHLGDAPSVRCAAGDLAQFDAVLCRTMPLGSLEQITFRLTALHTAVAAGVRVINCPRTLEAAIDKYATLARVASLGFPVPETTVVQSRGEAMAAWKNLGGDVVVKPIFGGEGRGVMRIRDRELAWYTFSTLENLGSVIYVQRFVPPGGRDVRILIIGDQMFAVRRTNDADFRTNVAGGGVAEAIELPESLRRTAGRIAGELSLEIGAVDLIDCDSHGKVVIEVNAVPGWKGAQGCLGVDLAERIIGYCAQAVPANARSEPTGSSAAVELPPDVSLAVRPG